MFAQIPEIDRASELRPETFKGGFVWAVNFKLPQPAEQDGYIVQKIQQVETGTINRLEKQTDGSSKRVEEKVNREIFYYEAWEVKKGETTPKQQQTVSDFSLSQGGGVLPSKYHTLVNDIFFRKYEGGSVGTYVIRGFAGFYHASLPSDFVVGHSKTGAGQLRSTTEMPPFWTKQASLFRDLTFTFDFLNNISSMMGNISSPTPVGLDYRPICQAFGY